VGRLPLDAETYLEKRPPPPGWDPSKSIPAIPVGVADVHKRVSVVALRQGCNGFLAVSAARLAGQGYDETLGGSGNLVGRQGIWLWRQGFALHNGFRFLKHFEQRKVCLGRERTLRLKNGIVGSRCRKIGRAAQRDEKKRAESESHAHDQPPYKGRTQD